MISDQLSINNTAAHPVGELVKPATVGEVLRDMWMMLPTWAQVIIWVLIIIALVEIIIRITRKLM